MQFAVAATLQGVHHDDDDLLAVLALVPLFPAFFAAPSLPFRLATMTLTTE